MLRNYRKPLIIATPKIGLKHPKAVSQMADFQPGTSFKPTYVDTFGSGQCKKVVLCTGKIFFDIQAKLEAENKNTGY